VKKKSEIVKEVIYEKWKTPIMHNNQLWLHFILQTITGIHFFFTLDQEKAVHIMTIDSARAYRVTEESLGYHCIGKYFKSKKPLSNRVKKCSTWKLWNTSFILDMETGNALSGYAKKRNKKYFEYLISAQDEDIEFISYDEPVWEKRENVKIDKLINEYVKKSL
jgi:hypothetical protein